ncbi:MAG: tetratricopeptide repeat protein [Acidobacteria bacterium]|nr:tetratricopeptide repeat protein [Acidobacteriota bacterium]
MKSGCVSQQTKAGRSVKLPVLNNSPDEKTEIRPSKAGRWRAAALIVLQLLMLAHIIQWRIAGTTVSPIEPSESMFTLQNGAINAGFIFFILAILATLIFGRFVCGWGCHILALQDFCGWLLKKIGLTPRPFRSRLLVFVPLIVALYMFVWPTVGRYFAKPASEPLFPQFTNHLITTDFWATFPPVWVAIPFLFVCGFMTVYFLGQKGFCTYACPYGGFFGLADKVAPGKIRVTDACNQCGHCTATCTSNVIVHAEVKQYGMVVDPGCMKCMDCVSVCPNDALYFGFGKPSVFVGIGSDPVPQLKKNYSITWPEEIFAVAVFAASLFAVWDVYQLVPLLMALGIATVTTYLAVRISKLVTAADQSFYRWNLKSGGTIKKAGWAFAAFAALWIGLNAHSGWVRYHERAGAIAFQNLQIPDELALAQADPDQWLSQTDRANIAAGQKHFHDAVDLGLFVNKEALSKFAWIEFLGGSTEHAVTLLEKAARYQSGEPRALSLYYRGAILNRVGRYDEAVSDFDKALAERSDLTTAREQKGESLWQLGRKDEAVGEWKEAVKANPRLPLANFFLAGAAASNGVPEIAEEYEKQANKFAADDPYFHWMLGLRLQNVGMNALAEKHFGRATELNPAFHLRRNRDANKR